MNKRYCKTIDAPAVLVFDYVAKIRENLHMRSKRLKYNQPYRMLRPKDFPGIDLQLLSDVLLHSTFEGTYVDVMMRDHISGLIADEEMKWYHVVESVLKAKSGALCLRCNLCDVICEMVPIMQAKSFKGNHNAEYMISTVKSLFRFVLDLIIEILSLEGGIEDLQILYESKEKAYKRPLETLEVIVRDKLSGGVLSLYSTESVKEELLDLQKLFRKRRDEPPAQLIERVLNQHYINCIVPIYEFYPHGLTYYSFGNPAIRMLVPIFACFRNEETCERIAGTIRIFSDIMDVTSVDVFADMLHGSLLLKCEETLDGLTLPKQHRLDFRWHATSFFYKKLPQIIKCLIEGGRFTALALAKGLEKSLDEHLMMWDAVDVAWQNASFLTLLRELEPVLGSRTTESLRNRRRSYMKTSSRLIPFSETDVSVIADTDVDKLQLAVNEVMNLQLEPEEKFWRTFEKKVRRGEYESFDAVIAVLRSESRMYDVGKTYSAKIKRVQGGAEFLDERIRSFDETFLLLSRVLIMNPSLPIKMFLNGGKDEQDGEKTIFYKWSMWYVKRVTDYEQTEERTDHEEAELRKEAEKLAIEANVEVGLETENQLMAEEAKKEKEELESKALAPEDLFDDFPMITLPDDETRNPPLDDAFLNFLAPENNLFFEEPPQRDFLAPLPPDFSSELAPPGGSYLDQLSAMQSIALAEIEKEARTVKRKHENAVTWNALNCPLPRISKKTATKYLAMLKEGFPFWDVSESSLNLGALVAAVVPVGELLLKEHDDKRHRIDRKGAEDTMLNILHALAPMSCLFICLVEWLDCEPPTAGRISLANAMYHALEKCAASPHNPNHKKWIFVQSTINPMLIEIIDRTQPFPEVSAAAYSAARRFCPFVFRDETPDPVKLKHAWYYMRQQGWSSPHALRVVEHSNIAGDYNCWTMIYVLRTVKTLCGEVMKSSTDMLLGLLMLDDLNSIVRMNETLVDWIALLDDENSQIETRFDPLVMTAIAKLLTHVLLIAEWALDRLRSDDVPLDKDYKPEKEIKAPQPDDPHWREKWIYLLDTNLDRTFERFQKILERAALNPIVNIICQLLKAIAGTPHCKPRTLLMDRINPHILFQIAYVDPTGVEKSLLELYCEPGNEDHRRTKVMVLCAGRRGKIL